MSSGIKLYNNLLFFSNNIFVLIAAHLGKEKNRAYFPSFERIVLSLVYTLPNYNVMVTFTVKINIGTTTKSAMGNDWNCHVFFGFCNDSVTTHGFKNNSNLSSRFVKYMVIYRCSVYYMVIQLFMMKVIETERS